MQLAKKMEKKTTKWSAEEIGVLLMFPVLGAVAIGFIVEAWTRLGW